MAVRLLKKEKKRKDDKVYKSSNQLSPVRIG